MNQTLLRVVLLSAALASSSSPAPAQAAPKQTPTPATKPAKDEALRQELQRMLAADQAVRAPMEGDKANDEAVLRGMTAVDAANTKRLAEIFDTRGFPGVELVGADAAMAFVTMLLHSPSLELQKKALPHVKRAVRRGELPAQFFALLTDDVREHEGKPQLYGTNFGLSGGKLVLSKTKDPAHLDERRKKLGLPPIRDYARLLGEMYKLPVDEASLPR
jgi:hypothetical protein